MFFGQIEREMLSTEIYAIWQNRQLPENLHLQIHQELGKQDIWETQSQESPTTLQKPEILVFKK